MSIEIALKVWNYTESDLTATQKAILARMAFYASHEGNDIYPSIATLCQQTSLKRACVIKNLGALKDNGFLVATEKEAGKTVKYKISLCKLGMESLESQTRSMKQTPTKKRGSTKQTQPVHQADMGVHQIDGGVHEIDPPRPPNGPNRLNKDNLKTTTDELLLLAKNLISEKELNLLINKHGEALVREKLELLQDEKNVDNPVGWLMSACKNNWARNKDIAHKSNGRPESLKEFEPKKELSQEEMSSMWLKLKQGQKIKLLNMAARIVPIYSHYITKLDLDCDEEFVENPDPCLFQAVFDLYHSQIENIVSQC